MVPARAFSVPSHAKQMWVLMMSAECHRRNDANARHKLLFTSLLLAGLDVCSRRGADSVEIGATSIRMLRIVSVFLLFMLLVSYKKP